MNEFELFQLRSLLPRGYRAKIRKATNYSYSYIDQVMAGARRNDRIIEIALELLHEDVVSKKSRTNRFRQILDLSK
jgi:hypothetical protein